MFFLYVLKPLFFDVFAFIFRWAFFKFLQLSTNLAHSEKQHMNIEGTVSNVFIMSRGAYGDFWVLNSS